MIKLTGKNTYIARKEQGLVKIDNGSTIHAIKRISENTILIDTGNRLFQATILRSTGKEYEVQINNILYTLQIEDEKDMLLTQLGINNRSASKINDVKAPMPGLIVDVRVVPGQKVSKGDILLILEAMKMENVLKAEHDGTISQIQVSKGDKVEKNQILIRF